jgi:hypothetical protein
MDQDLRDENKPFACAVDNCDKFVVTISKLSNVKVWNIANHANFHLVAQFQ